MCRNVFGCVCVCLFRCVVVHLMCEYEKVIGCVFGCVLEFCIFFSRIWCQSSIPDNWPESRKQVRESLKECVCVRVSACERQRERERGEEREREMMRKNSFFLLALFSSQLSSVVWSVWLEIIFYQLHLHQLWDLRPETWILKKKVNLKLTSSVILPRNESWQGWTFIVTKTWFRLSR